MSVRLEIFTLVLDGMPWIRHHLPVFNRLSCDWRWTICHGVAANVKDTKWIQPQDPRLSNDGTTEYLAEIAKQHPRVRVMERPLWNGKTEMCNAAMAGARAPCIVLQVDADELWAADQIESMLSMFVAMRQVDKMQFWCRYFLGPNIIIGPRDGKSYGCRQTEWLRAWYMSRPDQYFVTHEPPVFSGSPGKTLSRDETLAYGIQFDHFAYATRAQVAYKERVYGYPGAVDGWDALQRNTSWPVKLKNFLPWVDEQSTADLLVR